MQEIFHRALNANTKAVVDTITSKAFMSLCWEHAFEIHERITKTSQGFYSQEADRPTDTYAIRESKNSKYQMR